MKLNRLFILALAGFGLAGFSAPSSAQDAAPRPFQSMTSLIDGIRASKTPSDAITAYASAYAATGSETMTERAFILRMIDFGVPEMSEKQAQSLAAHGADGVAYGVLAFSSARADKLDEAVVHIKEAARISPNDLFVQRTAGQVLAWYDVKSEQAAFKEPVQKAAEDVRERLGSRRAFVTAYNDIHDPIQSLYATDENGGPILANTDLATLGAFSGYSRSGSNSPMALFYQAPFALFPGYNPWYQPLGADVYYYQNWWKRGVGNGRLFPFPAVDRDTRFLKLPQGGFALVGDNGTSLYQPIQYNAYWGPNYGYDNGYFVRGLAAPGYVNAAGPGFGYIGAGGFSRARSGGPGPNRISQRMNSGPRFSPTPQGISSGNSFRVGSAPFQPARFGGGRGNLGRGIGGR